MEDGRNSHVEKLFKTVDRSMLTTALEAVHSHSSIFKLFKSIPLVDTDR